ncbi:hypothetical protein HZF05_13750 [Sphingomonas sp. CGMCC 1.13654]|uniref:Uncharacterized protein n=1 Tax=Sphingomonas chungangi TaxID=2683589 RepID=A0A838L9D0_9SPHN|nr:hypothetical protein [Sphingomonas chungangi]MBA2935149.1 hypothetical protein [Sphingomonas chungangi]MVW57713.1 hypothetical protein [Sphingomonas chungangi]
MGKGKAKLVTGTAIVPTPPPVSGASIINGDKRPDPRDPHSWLPLTGTKPGVPGLRVMHGTLRLDYRGWRNSAEAMARAKLVPVPSSDPLAITAIRHEVLVPTGADDTHADPWLLPRLIDHGLARESEGKTPIWCYVTVTDPYATHMHASWRTGRRVAEHLCDRHGVPVMLVQHAPQQASNAATPHLHFLIGVRRLDARGFSTVVKALACDKARDLFIGLWAEVEAGG